MLKNMIKTLAVGTAAVGAAFALSELKAKNGTLKGDADYLMILGYRILNDTPDEILVMRVKTAAEYLLKHPNTVAICCGGILHDDQSKSEAEYIYEMLCESGIERERILLDDRSKTTYENFVNAKTIIEGQGRQGEKKLAFVSSEYHLMRAKMIAGLAGVEVESLAAPSPKKGRAMNYAREALAYPVAYLECFYKKN